MRALQFTVLSVIFQSLISCGGGSPSDNGIQVQGEQFGGFDPVNLSLQTIVADAYCTNQKKLQLISASLLSAYSPKGNGADTANCGGENVYVDDGVNFSLQLKNYCIVNQGKQYTLNGSISGATESGNNFTSTISNLNIKGVNVDLSIDGDSYAGRADDNFVNLNVFDNLSGTPYSIDKSSVKKGEFDFGYFTFPSFEAVHYQFITHFNEANTEGLLYLYGAADDKIIVSADNGMITAVYSVDRHDPGTWLDLPCNN